MNIVESSSISTNVEGANNEVGVEPEDSNQLHNVVPSPPTAPQSTDDIFSFSNCSTPKKRILLKIIMII